MAAVPTIDHAAQMKRAIPNTQLAVVPGADHGRMFSKPELANSVIMGFFAE